MKQSFLTILIIIKAVVVWYIITRKIVPSIEKMKKKRYNK